MVDIKSKLSEIGLKITPQRLIIFEAINSLNHPTADDIIKYIRQKHSNIANGTVYKVLEKFIETGLIKKITTDKDIVRYDGLLVNHHHIYSSDSNLIKDFMDEELDKILQDYFKNKISDFKIEELTLQIKGKFK
jgi:Fur family peroxide stress response transcriptional regulator